MEAYHVAGAIGERGVRSVAFKARVKRDLLFVCIKRCSLEHLTSLEDIVAVHGSLRPHQNVLGFRAWYATPRHVYRVLELAAGGSLRGVIKADGGAPEAALRLFGADLLCGLFHIHASGVVLGALSPDSILLDEDGTLKICGFETASRVDSAGFASLEMSSACVAYLAPETLKGTPRSSFAGDIWSLGVVLWELCTGKRPFGADAASSNEALIDSILNEPLPTGLSAMLPDPSPASRAGSMYDMNDDFDSADPPAAPRISQSPQLAALLTRLLERDPLKRASWPEILSHPFWHSHKGSMLRIPTVDDARRLFPVSAARSNAEESKIDVSEVICGDCADSGTSLSDQEASDNPEEVHGGADSIRVRVIRPKESVELNSTAAQSVADVDDGIPSRYGGRGSISSFHVIGDSFGGAAAARDNVSANVSILSHVNREEPPPDSAASRPLDVSDSKSVEIAAPASLPRALRSGLWRFVIAQSTQRFSIAPSLSLSRLPPVRPELLPFVPLTLAEASALGPSALSAHLAEVFDSLVHARAAAAAPAARAIGVHTNADSGDTDEENIESGTISGGGPVALLPHHAMQLSAAAYTAVIGSGAAHLANAILNSSLVNAFSRLLTRSGSAAVRARCGTTLAVLLRTATALVPESLAANGATPSLAATLAGTIGVPSSLASLFAAAGDAIVPPPTDFALARQGAASALGELLFYTATQSAAESASLSVNEHSAWRLPRWAPSFIAVHTHPSTERDAVVRRSLTQAVANIAALAPQQIAACNEPGVRELISSLTSPLTNQSDLLHMHALILVCGAAGGGAGLPRDGDRVDEENAEEAVESSLNSVALEEDSDGEAERDEEEVALIDIYDADCVARDEGSRKPAYSIAALVFSTAAMKALACDKIGGLALAAATAAISSDNFELREQGVRQGLKALAQALITWRPDLRRTHRVIALAAAEVAASAALLAAAELADSAPTSVDAAALLLVTESNLSYLRVGGARAVSSALCVVLLLAHARNDAYTVSLARRMILSMTSRPHSRSIRTVVLEALAVAMNAVRTCSGEVGLFNFLGGDGADARSVWDAALVNTRSGAIMMELLVGSLIAAPAAIPWGVALSDDGGLERMKECLRAAAASQGDASLANVFGAAAALITSRLIPTNLTEASSSIARAVFSDAISVFADALPLCSTLLTSSSPLLRESAIDFMVAVVSAAPLPAGFSLLIWTPEALSLARARGGIAAAAAARNRAALHDFASAARDMPPGHKLKSALDTVFLASDDARAEDREGRTELRCTADHSVSE